MVRTIILLILLFSVEQVWAAQAIVDRTIIADGETFQLTIRSDGGEPDLSPLDALFDVLSRSKNSQMSIINGKVSSRTDWNIILMPKQTGRLVIPSIRVGTEMTSPIQIQVQSAAVSSNQNSEQDIILEVNAKPENPYVQAESLFTVKLLHAVDIQDGALSQPKLDNAVIERVGDDVRYQTQRNGRLYQVTERRYALFPQTSGNLEIPPIQFSGNVVQQRGNFNFDPFNRFFSQGVMKPLRINSRVIKLNVRPKPAVFSGNDWLPSEHLSINASWSNDPPKFKVGEPITRTILIQAKGLTAAQLPSLPLPNDASFKFYPDQPRLDTQTENENLIGIREEKIAIVPTRDGQFVLPAINVKWWNTITDKIEIASIPAQSIMVQAGDLNSPATQFQPTNNSASATDSEAIEASRISAQTGNGIWPWLSLVLAIAWISTLAAWQIPRISKSKTDRSSIQIQARETERDAIQAIKSASLQSDAARTRDALMTWAAIRWPEKKPATTQELVLLLNAPHLADAIEQFNRANYSAKTERWDGKAFWDTISPYIVPKTGQKSDKKQTLSPLYP